MVEWKSKGASPNYFFHYNVIVTLFLDPSPLLYNVTCKYETTLPATQIFCFTLSKNILPYSCQTVQDSFPDQWFQTKTSHAQPPSPLNVTMTL